MFLLALLFLVLTAAFIHRIRIGPPESGETDSEDTWAQLPALITDSPELKVILASLLILWPIFVVEALVRFYLRPPSDRTARNSLSSLAPALFPPLRMAVRGATRPDEVWFPGVGWQEVRFDLQKDLERFFSAPMLVLALLILPILAIEYFWAEQVQAWPALRLGLDIGISIIWIAFATEFIVRISVADSKLNYAFAHWLDLAIVLLPMFEFMPALRLLRVARIVRIDTIVAFVKYYRLYGLAGKGWRALVILEVLQRLFSRKPQAKLARLRSRLESKETEVQALQREIDYYRRKIEEAEKEYTRDEGHPPPGPDEPMPAEGVFREETTRELD